MIHKQQQNFLGKNVWGNDIFLFLLETAPGLATIFYEKMAQQLGYGLGSVLLLALILLTGSVRKWLTNKRRSRSRKVELTGLRVRHTGVQQQLCQLQVTYRGKITIGSLTPAAVVESDGGEQSFLQNSTAYEMPNYGRT
ncbi:MAG: hypothetical protein GY862_29320 [Gammaproteobacteria bacterium]|nr:hypothetical protein [Gammaproteobacteria bacterium]